MMLGVEPHEDPGWVNVLCSYCFVSHLTVPSVVLGILPRMAAPKILSSTQATYCLFIVKCTWSYKQCGP